MPNFKLVEESAKKIINMEVRGASRIARFAAETLKEFAKTVEKDFDENMRKASEILMNTRPTAVSLFNAINYVMMYKGENDEEKKADAIRRAEEFIRWVDTAKQKIGEIGAKRIKDGWTILTHCNSSTALMVIKTAFRQGKNIEVIATESRPRYQGHLTVKELAGEGIPTTLIVDSAVRYFMKDVDCVIVGADTITVNGALINKIGTSQIALCARESRVPFMVCAETYKFSPATLFGELVVIEERDAREVAPEEILNLGVKVRNPAFDVTPREYIDLIVTEIGAIPPEMAYVIIRERLGYGLEMGELKVSAKHFD
ncbi:ribose 1,5-bisphosphate isomerase [Archaeoglobus profundus]|uniref:Ribose 1,5-bisphosphate isomerase n=1 Tax=Archaeoglobus profundus (strain DSM 5631 / JCM 9629 / NBRC 100127 / Av18) TaxID=572546 RepID=D2RDV0_ARCPA|nr:ribose 1,5-bisphosphate isomerase [Archaeoglobus profundus]ADB58294.1 translation initiation factor, aIF-2BII family [Archaeoglobus profundus DSM 5631]